MLEVVEMDLALLELVSQVLAEEDQCRYHIQPFLECTADRFPVLDGQAVLLSFTCSIVHPLLKDDGVLGQAKRDGR